MSTPAATTGRWAPSSPPCATRLTTRTRPGASGGPCDIASGKQTTGDTTTLEDYNVLAKLREEEE
jgi:hypothetical protein